MNRRDLNWFYGPVFLTGEDTTPTEEKLAELTLQAKQAIIAEFSEKLIRDQNFRLVLTEIKEAPPPKEGATISLPEGALVRQGTIALGILWQNDMDYERRAIAGDAPEDTSRRTSKLG